MIKLVMDSKPATAPHDPLPTYLVKKYIDVLGPVIARIVNISLAAGTFFPEWKMSIVQPLIKKLGLELIMSNYRPISNLPFISKVTEKAVLEQFVTYANDNHLFPSYQSAYRKFFSTETALLKIMNDCLSAMEEQQVTAFVGIDLSSAFDTVDHSILLEVLKAKYGVDSSALQWFQSYLMDRTMKVKINNCQSMARKVQSSVPQGSIAGPILFSAYASTLPSAISDPNVHLMGYADDHGLYKSFPLNSSEFDNIKTLEDTLMMVKQWMTSNRLMMNDAKTEFLYIGSRQQLEKCTVTSIKVGDCDVPCGHSIKYLGVILDSTLSLNE